MGQEKRHGQAPTGVNALVRWKRRMFRNDFFAVSEGTGEGSRPGGGSAISVGGLSRMPSSVTSRIPKLGSRDRLDGTNRDRCLLGAEPSSPCRRVSGAGDGSRNTEALTAKPSAELRDGVCCALSVLEGVDEPDGRRRRDVRLSHWMMLLV